MERAGAETARAIAVWWKSTGARGSTVPRTAGDRRGLENGRASQPRGRIRLVFCGRGSNGATAEVVARRLKAAGFVVRRSSRRRGSIADARASYGLRQGACP
jgi:NAD(P)H-hydrate repair Nnr-like enzyme with NAD(P)H-hydrate epimerase domain